MDTELPMHLDTVIVSPDQQKVHLVWRSMVISDYQPKTTILKVLDRATQDELNKQQYTKNTEIVWPYEKV